MVHRNNRCNQKQGESEPVRHFISRLKEALIDCTFTIPCNNQDCRRQVSYTEEMIRDQAVYGLYWADPQTKILALGSTLIPLKDVLDKSEIEEQAKLTQTKLSGFNQSE